MQLLDPAIPDHRALWHVDQYVGTTNSPVYAQNLLSIGEWQYATWYHADRGLRVGRRHLCDPTWQVAELPHLLSSYDSHKSISIAVSRSDWRLHVACDCHVGPITYGRTAAGMVDPLAPAPTWDASVFEPLTNTLLGVDLGPVTYPTFVETAAGGLLMLYRTGGPADGRARLAEYDSDTWTLLGDVTSSVGTWVGPNGGTSTSRNFYWNPIIPRSSAGLWLTGTWREGGAAVSCNGLKTVNNHGMHAMYSPDEGRTWFNSAGVQIGETGVSPVAVGAPGFEVQTADMRYAPMNSVGVALSSDGRPFILWDYVPGRFTSCVPDEAFRIANAKAVMIYLDASGVWTTREIKLGGTANYPLKHPHSLPLARCGRSHIVMDAGDRVFALLPGLRVLVANPPNYTDWSVVFDGSDMGVFNEFTVDASHLPDLYVAYQQTGGNGTTAGASPFCVRHLQL